MQKSSVDEIRERFDRDVERFSNLETGHSAFMDATLVLDLVTQAAAQTAPDARCVLDLGCGAGNYTLKLLERLPNLNVDLIDLSRPMLDRAQARLAGATSGEVRAMQGDVRELALEPGRYGLILAAAVLHHLRGEDEWKQVFAKLARALKPGGWLWIADLIAHTDPRLQALHWQQYGVYLTNLRDEAYREAVFAYTEREDTPRPLVWQLDLLRASGFDEVEVLHKRAVFAAFGARRKG